MTDAAKLKRLPDLYDRLRQAKPGDVWLTDMGVEVELISRYPIDGVWVGHVVRGNGTGASAKWDCIGIPMTTFCEETRYPLVGPKWEFESTALQLPPGYTITPVPPTGIPITVDMIEAAKQRVLSGPPRKEYCGGWAPRCAGGHDVIDTGARVSECRICRTRMRFENMEWVVCPEE